MDRGMTLADAVAFLTSRVGALARVFLVLLVVLTAIAWYVRRPEPAPVRATVTLSFHGIETQAYPDGRPFQYSDLQAGDVLQAAIVAAGLQQRASPERLHEVVSVAPVIPPAVVSRWQQQDRQGQNRERFVPREVRITVAQGLLTIDESIRLAQATVSAYQDSLRGSLYAGELRVAGPFKTTDEWQRIDPWELPSVMQEVLPPLKAAIAALLRSATRDVSAPPVTSPASPGPTVEDGGLPFGVNLPDMAARFGDLDASIDLFERTDLASLSGYTFRHGLVADRALALDRAEFRIARLTDRISARQRELDRTRELLQQIDRPQFMVQDVSGMARPVELSPDVIGALLKNDYYAEVVRRASETGSELARLVAERDAAQRLHARLQGLSVVTPPTAEYQQIAKAAVASLTTLLSGYEELVTRYLDLVAARAVTITEGPYVDQEGRPPFLYVFLSVVVVSLVLALVGVLAADVLRRSRRLSVK